MKSYRRDTKIYKMIICAIISVLITPLLPISAGASSIERVPGRYFYELVFDYDNSKNKNTTIVEKHTYTISKDINFLNFLMGKFGVKSQYIYNNQYINSIKFISVEEVEATNLTVHKQIATDLVNQQQKNSNITESSTLDREYKIGPGDQLSVYQLCYEMDGVLVKSDIFSSSLKPDLHVNLKFGGEQRILGLPELLDQLSTTSPVIHNIGEWQAIRDKIQTYNEKDSKLAFANVIDAFLATNPHRNILEWNQIRQTSAEIKADFDKSETQILFLKLLTRLSNIHPLEDNKLEWQAINALSYRLLKDIKPAT